MTRVINEKLEAEVGILIAGPDSVVVSKRNGKAVTLPIAMYLTAFNEAGWTLKPTGRKGAGGKK
jgi:hypothetical protein